MSRNNELMNAIAREIADTDELHGIDWVEVSAIFSIDADGDVNASYGYAYDTRGEAHAVAFLYDPVERAVKAYSDWLQQESRTSIVKMLFQFNRNTRRIHADFEHDDPLRWQVTPGNLDARIEELRPRLGSSDDR